MLDKNRNNLKKSPLINLKIVKPASQRGECHVQMSVITFRILFKNIVRSRNPSFDQIQEIPQRKKEVNPEDELSKFDEEATIRLT